MSFLSDKTGRPKEERGHSRKNISLDVRILRLMKQKGIKNNSKYIENLIMSDLLFWDEEVDTVLSKQELPNDKVMIINPYHQDVCRGCMLMANAL